MGGPGSGNFNHSKRPPKRPLVEHGRRLRVSLLRRYGYFESAAACGTITFGDRFALDVETFILPELGTVGRLTYTAGNPPTPVDEFIGFATTCPRFGGVRWWFRCPGCARRVGVLYLPNGCAHFRCRACYRLTYDKRQNGHRHRAFFETELGQAMRPLLDLADKVIRRGW